MTAEEISRLMSDAVIDVDRFETALRGEGECELGGACPHHEQFT